MILAAEFDAAIANNSDISIVAVLVGVVIGLAIFTVWALASSEEPVDYMRETNDDRR